MLYEKTTRSITVAVRPVYLKEQSRPKDSLFVWGYEVSIRNDGKETVQLLNRHWIISNNKGEVDEVWGPGVVGQQPILRAGENFRYSSFTRLSTPSGVMEGTYDMQSEAGRRFEIQIPEFRLEFPVRIVPIEQTQQVQ